MASDKESKNLDESKLKLNKTSKNIGISLIAIGVALLIFVFYEAYASFLNPGFIATINNATSSNSIPIAFTAEALVILLIKVAFLGIALAAGSTILSKGVELIK
ncbi:MAG: hypothetical protein ACP5I6_02125 [Caldisphaera sp.]|jgi:hypothetical protein|nr:hypothetical protein [Caldisphaera sp.]PMP59447.1 MAG: hypothetical protein C0202_02225 [Caldisphaera sp.]PMP88952.1 MAG: hypothetical protein C0172_01375 [Caldisphaera sp.]